MKSCQPARLTLRGCACTVAALSTFPWAMTATDQKSDLGGLEKSLEELEALRAARGRAESRDLAEENRDGRAERLHRHERRLSLRAQVAVVATPWRRSINERRNTLLKRSWHADDDCSSSVELTRTSVSGPVALIVAVRLAPRT